MELDSFETKNFKARDGVAEASETYVRDSLRESQIDGLAKVVVADVGGGFFFSIVAKSRNKIFSNELRYTKLDVVGWPRDWQFGAINKLIANFLKVVRRFPNSDAEK